MTPPAKAASSLQRDCDPCGLGQQVPAGYCLVFIRPQEILAGGGEALGSILVYLGMIQTPSPGRGEVRGRFHLQVSLPG